MSDESGGNDAEYMFCMNQFSEDGCREKWSKYIHCTRWAHLDCRGLRKYMSSRAKDYEFNKKLIFNLVDCRV